MRTGPGSWRRLVATAAVGLSVTGVGIGLTACGADGPSGPQNGGDGNGVALARPFLIVARRAGDVSYLDPASGAEVGSTSLLPSIGDLVVAPDGSEAYATGGASEGTGAASALWVLDLTSGEATAEHGAGLGPGALAVAEGSRVWMTLSADAIAEVDAATGERRLLPLESGAFTLAYATGSGRLYALGTITSIVDAAAASVVGRIDLGTGVSDAVLADDESVLYVSHLSNDVTEIDVAEAAVARTLSYAEAPGMVIAHSAEVAVRPGAGEVLLTSSASPELVAVDAVSLEVVRRLELEGDPTDLLVAPDGTAAYLCLSDRGDVLVVDLDAWEVANRFAVGGAPVSLGWAAAP